MIGNSPNQKQKHLFLVNLAEFINPNHRLCLLAEKIDWDSFETNFAPLYSNFGAPARTDSADGRVVDFETSLQFRG